MASRLPVPGSDNGTWGILLNDYLGVSLNTDGTMQPSALTQAGGYSKPSTGVPATDLDTATQTALNSSVKLSGDLGGTTASPQVVTTHLAAALPISQGGTGSTTKNFVDLSGVQTVTNKSISGATNTVSALPLSALSATGTRSSTTYLRGDNTWASVSGSGSTSVALGHPPGDSSGQVGAPQQWFANLQTATTSRTITTLQAYCATVSGSNTVQMGIYNEAGTLLSSGTVAVTTTGKFTVTLGAGVTVVQGNNIWLALCNQTNTAGTTFSYFQGNANSTLVNRYAGGTTLPTTLPAGNATATVFCVMAY